MFDMVKEGLLSGQQYLEILKEHIPQETSPDIILGNCRRNVSTTIEAYVPNNRYAIERTDVFNMFLDTIIQSQQEADIRQTLLDVTIGFAESDD